MGLFGVIVKILYLRPDLGKSKSMKHALNIAHPYFLSLLCLFDHKNVTSKTMFLPPQPRVISFTNAFSPMMD